MCVDMCAQLPRVESELSSKQKELININKDLVAKVRVCVCCVCVCVCEWVHD